MARLAPRSQRVGGIEVAPGHSAVVSLGPPNGQGVSAWVAVGKAPGPRVSVLAAASGFEVAATLAARALAREIDLASLAGSLVVAPLFRPGDRFARSGRRAAAIALPGDAGGNRRARLAFSLYSDVVVNVDPPRTDTRPPHDNPRNGLRTAAGTLMLQGHDPTTDLSFRKIQAAELPPR